MPLVQGDSRGAVSENIRRELSAGKPRQQAIAIALNTARRTARAAGGYTPPSPTFGAREAYHEEESKGRPFNAGLIKSTGPGRTDIHNLDVPAGAYVLPADVVSGLGEGNTMAGAAVTDKMFGSMPYGIHAAPRHGGSTIPHAPAASHLAHGGGSGGVDEGRVPIVAAGGEVVIPPEVVAYHPNLGGGNPNGSPGHKKLALRRGHNVLDAFVKHVRAKTIKQMQKLPGPAR
jgi:hypothetical protein